MLFRNRRIVLTAVVCWVQVVVVSLGLSAEPGGGRVSMPERGICAHRGASDTHPENTLAAFREAIRLGAAMIEFDVALSADGKLVLIHDSTLDRTTNGTGPVSARTLEQLKTLDAGSWKAKRFAGAKVPTLDEALSMMPENIWLNVHLKEDTATREKLAADVTARIVAQGRLHQAFLACRSVATAAARRADPRIQICNMERQANTRQYVDETIAAGSSFIQLLGGKTVDPAHTRLLKQKRVRINYCCANDASKVASLFRAGVEFPLVDRLGPMLSVADDLGVARLKPVYRSRLKRKGLKTPRFPAVSRQPAGTRVRVTDLGAVADGKTDCLAAIRKAIAKVAAAGGGTVVFPRAKQPYLVSGTILIEASNITLSGPDATIKLADGAANGTKEARGTESQVHVLRVAGKPAKPVERIEIRGLTVDANIYRQDDYYNPRAIVIEHGHRVKVRDVTILRPFVGLDIGAGSSDCEVRGCVIEDWLEDGFDASGDADKGSGAITTNIRFIDCHARGAPKSTGNAWEIEDGVRHVRVIDCSVTDVPRGNAFGIRNHWKAGPVDISRDIQLRGVRIERVGGKYGIYSHSAPRDKFPRNRVTDIGLYDVHCLAPVMLAGQLESVRIVGGRYGVIHLGWEYGSKASREPGGPLPLLETRISIRNVHVRGLNINATAGRFTLSNVLIDASGEPALPQAVRIVGGGDRVRLSNCTITGAGKVGVALQDEAAPRIVDSIIWGNPLAVGLGSGQPTFSHCCLQGGVPRGAGDRGDNLASDPRFQVVAERRFLLRHTAAGDVTASPCVDAGSRLAAAGGLDERTTRADRVRDTLQVDLGFHYPLKSAD